MFKLFDEIKNVLESIRDNSQTKKYFSLNDELLRSKVDEDARKHDPELISSLFNNQKCKDSFFEEISANNGKISVFLKDKFCQIINNHSFLPDSYTAFENKIGLTVNGNYLSRNNDVVLSFPHKDCVLEGGQTKEDQKRDEVFFIDVLAKDEISTMLEPKCFINAKRYDKDHLNGEDITEFKDNDNLVIKGNNLIALSSILPRYEQKVKLIYIDPPYNTGNDSFHYNDSFNHSAWLIFMKNRLELARQLLKEDGVICIQCDDNEQAYLKVLCDEIFGRDNFINNISVNMSNMSNTKVTHAILGKRFPKLKEYILVFTVDKNQAKFNIPKLVKDKWDKEYNKIIPDWTKELNIKYENDKLSNDDIKNLKYESLSDYIKTKNIKNEDQFKIDNAYRIFATKPNESLLNKAKKYQISSNENALCLIDNKLIIKNFNTDTETARIELLNAETKSTVYLGDNWVDITTTGGIAQEGNVVLKKGKKPEKLIERLIYMASNVNDIVMDFHLGSGTTCAVAHKMGRKYIGIEQMDYIEDLAVTRLKNVINGDQTGISKSVNWQGGGSFVYCELAKYNQVLIDKIKEFKTEEELNKIYSDLKSKDGIKTNIDPSILNQENSSFEKLSITDKKKVLISIIDKNTLYYNYSEIDDVKTQISDTDKAFSKSFYGD